MGELEKLYWVPWTMLVCSDDTQIHGLRLTLKMVEPKWDDIEINSNVWEKEEREMVSELAKQSREYDMNMIGAATGQCQMININKNDRQIEIIRVVADKKGVRNLELRLNKGKYLDYGFDKSGGLDEGMVQIEFDFSVGAKLFGMYGIVEVDQTSKANDTIKTLGFFRDYCNIDLMASFSSKQKEELHNRRTKDHSESLMTAHIFVIVISVIACCFTQCFCLYMFLKHRSKLGFGNKKKDVNGEAELVAEDSNVAEGSAIGLEITPQKHGVDSFSLNGNQV